MPMMEFTTDTPDWAQGLRRAYEAEIAHAFVLNFNVADDVLAEDPTSALLPSSIEGQVPTRAKEVMRIREYLERVLLRDFTKFIYYDLASGIGSRSKEEFQKVVGDKCPPAAAIDDHLKTIHSWLNRPEERVAVVIGFAETIFGEEQNPQQDYKARIIRLLQWARNTNMSKNAIVLLTQNKAQLAKSILTSASSFKMISVPLPNEAQRRAFVTQVSSSDEAPSAEALAVHGSGLTLEDILRILKESRYHGEVVTPDLVWKKKTDILENSTAGLLSVKRPTWTMDCLGGLDEAKSAILPVIEAIKKNDLMKVPQGILFIGPPGGGKSLLAEILASMSGLPIVVLGQIKDMWVGSSEARWAMVEEFLRNLAPEIVFEDEFDQSTTMRSSMGSLDSGVTENLRKQKMEFMADTRLRGKVLQIGATNRPDLMDPAFLRPGRFDLRVPFLPPLESEERIPIYKAIMVKMGKIESAFRFEISEEEWITIAELSQYKGNGIIPATEHEVLMKAVRSYTGAEIELICMEAWKRTEGGVLKASAIESVIQDFIPDRSKNHLNMIELALKYTNFKNFLPVGYREYFGEFVS